MDVLSTFELSDKYSISLYQFNKPVHFGSSLDFLYCSNINNCYNYRLDDKHRLVWVQKKIDVSFRANFLNGICIFIGAVKSVEHYMYTVFA